MNLIDIYKSILNTAGMKADDNGLVTVVYDVKSDPVTIDGKRLALPTPNNLNDASISNKIIFHPLRESLMRNESDVVQHLRQAINIRINFTIAAICKDLLKASAEIDNHSKLDPDQAEILSVLKEADDETVVKFVSIMLAAIKEHADRAFVNIYIKKGGTVNDRKYSRAGIVTFPFYNELHKNEDKIYGVKLRAADRRSFIALFEYIFPGIAEAGKYNVGSDSQVAPILDSLMRTVMGVACKLNDVLELFGNIIDEHETLMFDALWSDAFADLEALNPLIRQIPMQLGNEGKQTSIENAGQQAPQHVQTFQPQPTLVTQAFTPPIVNQFVPQQFNQPFAQQAPAGVVVTDKGVDFNSVVRSNPMLSMQANQMMMNQQAQFLNQQHGQNAPYYPTALINPVNNFQQQQNPYGFQQPNYGVQQPQFGVQQPQFGFGGGGGRV